MPKLDHKKVMATNPKIDVKVVAAYRKLERELEDLGVEVKPRYTLSHPLGEAPTGHHNRDR